MIRSLNHLTIVYTNHEVILSIVFQIKLITSSTNKANLRLIRAFTYFSQFRLDIKHKLEKTHIVSNALSRLFSRNTKDEDIDSLNILHISTKDDEVFVFNDSLIKVFENFRKRLI